MGKYGKYALIIQTGMADICAEIFREWRATGFPLKIGGASNPLLDSATMDIGIWYIEAAIGEFKLKLHFNKWVTYRQLPGYH